MTGSGYNRNVDGVVRKFGVSGFLYNSDVLLWDDCGESFWSQVEGKAIAGPETDKELTWLHVKDITFGKFKKDFPAGEVLVGPNPRQTYGADPYKSRGYDKDDSPGFLPKEKADRRMHQKAIVTGVTLDEKAFCIPHAEIAKVETPLEVKFGEQTLTIAYDEESDSVSVTIKATDKETEPKAVVALRAYWFAWAVFHPDTTVFEITDEMKRKPAEKAEPEDSSPEKEEEFGRAD